METPYDKSGDASASVVDLLNRLLDKGVVVDGELLISLADVELIYVGLKVLLVSSERLHRERRAAIPEPAAPPPVQSTWPDEAESVPPSFPEASATIVSTLSEPVQVPSPELPEPSPRASVATPEVRIDPDRVEAGIVKLVLTVIELLRKVMERQAVNRVEGGRLTERQIERLGVGLMRLEEKMEELKKEFGLTDEDLNLDLGPLGKLL